MSPRVLEQARRVLQVIEAGAHSREHTTSGSTFSISPATMLELLANEFNNHDPEDGRYATPQRRQESENSPATTGEFNHTLNTAVHKVRQPRADEETSSAYARRRAAQEQLSQSAPTLRERVKPEPVAPPVVDSEYYRAQQRLAQWNEEFHNRVMVQRYRNADLQATGATKLPDQNIIFDQNGIPRDSNDARLRRDPTHEPTELGSPPLEYRDGPDGGDGGNGSDPSCHGDSRSQSSRHSSWHSSAAQSLRFETACRSSRSRPPSHNRSRSTRHDKRRPSQSSHRR